MNVLGVGAPAPTSLSSSALHFRLKVTNILPPSPIYHSRTVYFFWYITGSLYGFTALLSSLGVTLVPQWDRTNYLSISVTF